MTLQQQQIVASSLVHALSHERELLSRSAQLCARTSPEAPPPTIIQRILKLPDLSRILDQCIGWMQMSHANFSPEEWAPIGFERPQARAWLSTSPALSVEGTVNEPEIGAPARKKRKKNNKKPAAEPAEELLDDEDAPAAAEAVGAKRKRSAKRSKKVDPGNELKFRASWEPWLREIAPQAWVFLNAPLRVQCELASENNGPSTDSDSDAEKETKKRESEESLSYLTPEALEYLVADFCHKLHHVFGSSAYKSSIRYVFIV
jgi:hypothetical protein